MPPTTGYPSNPGTVEDLHKKCQSIMPMFFEGAKLLVNKALNQNFQVSHTMTMSNMMPSGYRFGATYVGQKMLSPQEAYPLLLAFCVCRMWQRILTPVLSQFLLEKIRTTEEVTECPKACYSNSNSFVEMIYIPISNTHTLS